MYSHPINLRFPTAAACVFAIVATVFLAACSSSNSVEIVSFSPEGDVPLLSTIEIEFSRDLAPPDKQNVWLPDAFVAFSPALQGRFKWTSARRLIFSPDTPLEAMQEYEAEILDKVLFDTGFDPDFDDITFSTPDFDAVKAEVFWTHIPHQYYTVTVQANLHFNYPVDPAQLRDFLDVQRNGEAVGDIQIVSDAAAEVIAISIGEVKQEDAAQDITVIVHEGLMSVLVKKALEDTREFKTMLPPITQLAVTGVASGYDGNTGWIEVATTQMVDEDALRKYIRVDPGQRLEFFVSDNIVRIEGAFENAQTVSPLISSVQDRREVAMDISRIPSGASGHGVSADPARAVVVSGHGPEHVSVETLQKLGQVTGARIDIGAGVVQLAETMDT